MQNKGELNVIIDYIMISALTITAGFYLGDYFSISLGLCGIAILIYTMHTWNLDSMWKHGAFLCLEVLLCVLIGAMADYFIYFTLFLFLPRVKLRKERIGMILLATVFYFIDLVLEPVSNFGSLFTRNNEMLHTITARDVLMVLLLFFLCIVILLVKEFIEQSDGKLLKNSNVIREAAINEMNFRMLNEELEAKSYVIERNARMEEREKIARNIHNAVGHTITSALVALDASQALYEVSPERAKEKVIVAGERMRLSLDEIRRAVRVLDSGAQEVKLSDFIAMLEMEIEQFVMDTERKVRHNLKDSFPDASMPAEHAEFLHGAVAEACSNGIRHGGATAFLIVLECDTNHIRITVTDNGKNDVFQKANEEELSFSEQYPQVYQNGFGLKKMEEYTKKCGGSMKVKCKDGFSVILQLPL